MAVLSAEFSNGSRRQLAEAPAFLILPDGELFAVGNDRNRRMVLSFRPGMARIGRPEIKEGAWYRGRRKVCRVGLAVLKGEPDFELYGDRVPIEDPRQLGVRQFEIGSMDGSLPYLWDVDRDDAVAESHDGSWTALRGAPGSWTSNDLDPPRYREITIAGGDFLPFGVPLLPGARSRHSALA